MTILDPDNSTHSIKLIPRYYNIDNVHTVSLYDEDLRTSSNLTIDTRTLSNGYIVYGFDLTTVEGKEYQIKITDNTTSNIVYRGKIFVTSQTTQDYNING